MSSSICEMQKEFCLEKLVKNESVFCWWNLFNNLELIVKTGLSCDLKLYLFFLTSFPLLAAFLGSLNFLYPLACLVSWVDLETKLQDEHGVMAPLMSESSLQEVVSLEESEKSASSVNLSFGWGFRKGGWSIFFLILRERGFLEGGRVLAGRGGNLGMVFFNFLIIIREYSPLSWI